MPLKSETAIGILYGFQASGKWLSACLQEYSGLYA